MKRVLAAVLCAMVATEVIGQTLTVSPTGRPSGGTMSISSTTSNGARIPNATVTQQALIDVLLVEVAGQAGAVAEARTALATAAWRVPVNDAELRAKADTLAGAELTLALARSAAFVRIQLSADRFAPEQIRAVMQVVTNPVGPAMPLWSFTPGRSLAVGSSGPSAASGAIITPPLTLSREPEILNR